MARYTDEERAEAVAVLQAKGYPDKKGSLAAASRTLGIPARTISRWLWREQNPPPDKLVSEKRRELRDLIEDEVYEVIGAMPGAREKADYRALTTALGIMIDKLRLLDGDTTENIGIRTILANVPDDELDKIIAEGDHLGGNTSA
jgi:transposase-like protein